ncbi:HTTM domain-containing protein [Streptomyces lydicus]|uniref:HTTM domain-containing protein n=1 Tax=Streptomyces lydicus TaxID=47763 RepID=UPI0037A10274
MTTDQKPDDAGIRPNSAADGTAPGNPDPVTRAFTFLTERAVSLHAAAVLRVGYGLLYLVFLLREFPHREEIWGPDSPWTPHLARELLSQTGWFSALTFSDRPAFFEGCYALALLTCALFTLGWHTRALSLLFALVVTSFHGRNIYITDGGDNLIVLMAEYLTLVACGRRWSLDARRKRLRAPTYRSQPRPALARLLPAWEQAVLVRGQLSTLLHNCGMFVIAIQVCILYGCAGLYKVQGSTWRDGTALHYVLNLDLFRPWPELSQFADHHQLFIAIAGYLTVLVQVACPFALFSRLKYVVIGLLIGMHIGIAVLLGLPVFSGAMIVADAVFLPDRFFLLLQRICLTRLRRAGADATVPRARNGNLRPPPSPGTPGRSDVRSPVTDTTSS